MRSNYTYHTLMSYIPKRYNATSQQIADRNEVYCFKAGNFSRRVLAGLESKIRSIASGGNYIICFIPGSSAFRTTQRYSALSRELTCDTGVPASLTGITNAYDRETSIATGKQADPTASFSINSDIVRGKRIILIDDVITRGRSFNQCADKLMAAGALSVTGLFVAETVNPDWHGGASFVDDGFDPCDYMEDEFDYDPTMEYEEDFCPEDGFFDEPDYEECFEEDFCPYY